MLALPSKKVGPTLGTDQHLLTLRSNYSALQGLNSTWNEGPTGQIPYLTVSLAGAHMDKAWGRP